MVLNEFYEFLFQLADTFLGKEVGKAWIFMGIWYVRQWKISYVLFFRPQLIAPGLQILLESLEGGLVDVLGLVDRGVYAVGAEIYLELELQFCGGVITSCKPFLCVFEELVPLAALKVFYYRLFLLLDFWLAVRLIADWLPALVAVDIC